MEPEIREEILKEMVFKINKNHPNEVECFAEDHYKSFEKQIQKKIANETLSEEMKIRGRMNISAKIKLKEELKPIINTKVQEILQKGGKHVTWDTMVTMRKEVYSEKGWAAKVDSLFFVKDLKREKMKKET
jgi:hypothetical protein